MPSCTHCGREMRTAASCDNTPWILQGRAYAPIPYGEEHRSRGGYQWYRCSDCGVARGGFHHPACDIEECPRCHQQLIACGCADTATSLLTPAA